MRLLLPSILGRLLLVPVALSGMCLTMFFGAPMAMAQTMEPMSKTVNAVILVDHPTVMTNAQDHIERPACCVGVRSQHEVKTGTKSGQEKTGGVIVAHLPRAKFLFPIEHSYLSNAPPHRVGSLSRVLVGTIIKRE